MNSPDLLENLWAHRQAPAQPDAQTVIRQAQAWQRRERMELGLAFGSLAATCLLLLGMAYVFYPQRAAWFLIGLALFLGLSTAQGWRYYRSLRMDRSLDARQYLARWQAQRAAGVRLERFIYVVYLPGLAAGIIGGMWYFTAGLAGWVWPLTSLATLGWIALATWWGQRRQRRKRSRLDALAAQWAELADGAG